MAGRERRHRKGGSKREREGKRGRRKERKSGDSTPSSNGGNSEKVDESETFDISDTDCMLGWLSIDVFTPLLLRASSSLPSSTLTLCGPTAV